MNYKLLALSALMFMSCGNGAPRITTDVEVANAHGAVKSIEQGSSKTLFNEQGYITATFHLAESDGGQDFQLSKIVYDESGVTPVEISNYKYFDDLASPTIERVELTADQQAQRGVAQKGCKYNSDGYLAQREFYVDHSDAAYHYYDGRPKYVSEYTYNDQNQLVELRSMRYGPKVTESEIDVESYVMLDANVSRYSYNAQGDIAEAVTTLNNGKEITYKYTYEYDQQGNWIEKRVNGKNPTQREISYYAEK